MIREGSFFAAGAALVAALLLAGCDAQGNLPVDAADRPEPAIELLGRVSDHADILGDESENLLSARLARLEEDSGVQFVVATTDTLNGKDVALYTRELGNAWGIGSSERNDGLILLVAPEDRLARIEVGDGLTGNITNAEAQHIMDVVILPEFAQGRYEAGVEAAVHSLAAEISPDLVEPAE